MAHEIQASARTVAPRPIELSAYFDSLLALEALRAVGGRTKLFQKAGVLAWRVAQVAGSEWTRCGDLRVLAGIKSRARIEAYRDFLVAQRIIEFAPKFELYRVHRRFWARAE